MDIQPVARRTFFRAYCETYRCIGVNFLEDYNSWRQAQNENPLFRLSEPAAKYVRQPKKINIDFRISTTLDNAELNSSKVLNTIRMDCEKYGYDFELL